MENYLDLKVRQSQELSDFPVSYAFSDKQLLEALTKLDAVKADVCTLGAGTVIKKTDVKQFNAMFARHSDEVKAAFTDNDVLIEAIVYELGNHEYCITHDPIDTIEALSLEMSDTRIANCFQEAARQYLDNNEGLN